MSKINLAHQFWDARTDIIFFSTRERWGALSNFAECQMKWNGIQFFSSEAVYQSMKFEDKQLHYVIAAALTPGAAKRISRLYERDINPNWQSIKIDKMREVLQMKLDQNPRSEFSDCLRASGEQAIVEKSFRDDFWGAKPTGAAIFLGSNVLGQLLMELRDSNRKLLHG